LKRRSTSGHVKSERKLSGDGNKFRHRTASRRRRGQAPDTAAACATAAYPAYRRSPGRRRRRAMTTYRLHRFCHVDTAANGSAFAASPTGTVNGAAAAVTRDDDTHITVTYSFSPTAAPYVPAAGHGYGEYPCHHRRRRVTDIGHGDAETTMTTGFRPRSSPWTRTNQPGSLKKPPTRHYTRPGDQRLLSAAIHSHGGDGGPGFRQRYDT
jgi:hypothetical protein